MNKNNVFWIVEDHPEVAENNDKWLKRIDENAYCLIFHNPEEAKKRLELELPNLIVVDLLYGKITGVQSAELGLNFLSFIMKNCPELNILVYSSEPSLLKPIIKEINLHTGGFVVANKLDYRSSFLEGAKNALNRELKIPRNLQENIILTEKESEVLKLLCQQCLSDTSIAEALHISKRTAQGHIQRLKEKLLIDHENEKQRNDRIAVCVEAIKRKIIYVEH